LERSTHSPERTCIGCGAKKPQPELLRVASASGSTPVLDASGNTLGRGAYICRDVLCFERAVRRKAFERSLKLKSGLSDTLKAMLLEEMQSKIQKSAER
jgi:predicted RNA-binding protein YlxR (DUF448 family)